MVTSLLDALLSPPLVLAIAAYGLLVVVVEWASARLHRAVEDVTVTAWMVEHIALPWGRAIAMIVFVFVAYPALFGLHAAPPLGALLGGADGRFTVLLNTAFVISLLLPLVPSLGRVPGLVLPLQGIAIAALLFHWLALSAGQTSAHYWPGWGTLAAIVALAAGSQPLAHRLGHWWGEHLNRRHNREGFEQLAYDGLLMLFQVPAILLYTLGLGRQLA